MSTRSHTAPRTLLAGASLIALAAFGLAACGDDDETGPAASDLEGRTFVSTSVEGQELVAGSTVTVTFDAGTLAVQGGCNTLAGGFELDGGELSVGQLAQTAMACDEALEAQDAWLAAFFGGGPTVSLDGDDLTLAEGDVTIRLSAAG
jgi:heat shock protein HslJ